MSRCLYLKNKLIRVKSIMQVCFSNNDINQNVFILQGWLILFWIENFVVVEMSISVACVEAEQYALEKFFKVFFSTLLLQH